jgi:hypothetical protein
MYCQGLADGRSDGIVMDEAEIQAGMDMTFEQAGWDVASGVPTRATLDDAGLAWVCKSIPEIKRYFCESQNKRI